MPYPTCCPIARQQVPPAQHLGRQHALHTLHGTARSGRPGLEGSGVSLWGQAPPQALHQRVAVAGALLADAALQAVQRAPEPAPASAHGVQRLAGCAAEQVPCALQLRLRPDARLSCRLSSILRQSRCCGFLQLSGVLHWPAQGCLQLQVLCRQGRASCTQRAAAHAYLLATTLQCRHCLAARWSMGHVGAHLGCRPAVGQGRHADDAQPLRAPEGLAVRDAAGAPAQHATLVTLVPRAACWMQQHAAQHVLHQARRRAAASSNERPIGLGERQSAEGGHTPGT